VVYVPELLPILRGRWSPQAFDVDHVVDEGQVDVLLEAARWAPSAGNSQPWAFHAVRRHAAGWQSVVDCLAGSSRPWATQAGLLVVNVAHLHVEGTDWDFSEFAQYDLGQAVAHMTIQAHSMGLACRQFRAFDRAALTLLLGVPDHWCVMTMMAIGRASSTALRDAGAGVRDANITWPRS
jgi:nitroreductase